MLDDSNTAAMQRNIGLALAILSAVSFASLGYFAHLLRSEGFSVVGSLALRFSLAAFVLWLLNAAGRLRRSVHGSGVKLRDRLVSMVSGALGYGGSAYLFFVAMERTSTGLANILLFQHPIVVLGLTRVTRRGSGLPWQLIAAVTVGLVFVLWPPTDTHFDALGIAAGVGAAIWYGAYLFFTESRSQKLLPRDLTLDVLTGCALAFLGFAAARGQLHLPHTPLAWGALFAQAIVCTIVSVLSLFAAFKYIGARDATLVSALEPVMTVIIGVAALGEPWAPLQGVGALLLIGAIVWVAQRPSAGALVDAEGEPSPSSLFD